MRPYTAFEREEMKREMEYVGRDMEEPAHEVYIRAGLYLLMICLLGICLIFGLDRLEELGRHHTKPTQGETN